MIPLGSTPGRPIAGRPGPVSVEHVVVSHILLHATDHVHVCFMHVDLARCAPRVMMGIEITRVGGARREEEDDYITRRASSYRTRNGNMITIASIDPAG